jgi:tetratricopeptide (TPR) repeat protein
VRLSVAIAVLVAGLLIAGAARPVRADAKRPDTPWSRGVPEAKQQRALQLFREGNVFFEQAKYTEAVAKYELALAAWDHPNIRFNMAICLINMRQPLVAWTHLQQALRFGEAPLGKPHHDQALTYVAVLESSLAQVTVKSSQPGVTVMIDGARALDGPGENTLKLLAGKHQLVATRTGFTTESRALDLEAGKPIVAEVALLPVAVAIQRENYERRWPWWVPWSVAGGGVVLGLAGGGVYAAANSQMKSYDNALKNMCPEGCEPADIPADLTAKMKNARRNSGVAIGMWVGAGALVIGGGVMAFLNRPTREIHTVTPTVTVARDHVGVGLSLTLD